MLAAIASCATSPPAPSVHPRQSAAETWEADRIQVEKTDITFEVTTGSRELDEQEAWSPLANQREFGLAFQSPFLGVRSEERLDIADYFDWDFGLRFAYDDALVTPAGATEPLHLGARTWDMSGGILFVPVSPHAMFQPYLGGGLALLFTDVDVVNGSTVQRHSDTFPAGYVRGGLRIQVRRGQYFGVDVRWLSGGTDVEGIDASAESRSISFLFGARF